MNLSVGQLLADSIGVVAFIRQQSVNPICDHLNQRAEALDIVHLSGRQNESEGATLGIAPGMEFGGAPPLTGLAPPHAEPFFMPTAQ